MRHERASVKADMWSYGILVWELISDQDITNLQPLAIAQAMQVDPCSLGQFLHARVFNLAKAAEQPLLQP